MCIILPFSFPRKPSTFWGWGGKAEAEKQRCLTLLGSADRYLLYSPVKCQDLVDSAWGQLDLSMPHNLPTVVWLSREMAQLEWLCDIHKHPLPPYSDSINLPSPAVKTWSDTLIGVSAEQPKTSAVLLLEKMISECLVPHESTCRKRGVSHHGQRANFPTFTQTTWLLAPH